MASRTWLAKGFELAARSELYPWMERLADAPVPAPLRGMVNRAAARVLGANVSEMEGRFGDYPTLAAFFTRRLRAGARPLDPDPAVPVSPADGVLQAAGAFAPGEDPVVEVKGAPVSIGTLLGGYRDAARAGGRYFVIYLSPRDYHRVHAPLGGTIRSWQAVAGTRYPVNRLGFAACREVLFRNERVVIEIDPEGGGRLYLALVAAWGVARIGLTFATPDEVRARSGGLPAELPEPRRVDRGGEVGLFNLGSTVVLIWPGAAIPVQSLRGVGPVRMGEGLVRSGSRGAR